MNKFVLIICLITSNLILANDSFNVLKHSNSTPIYNQQPRIQQQTPVARPNLKAKQPIVVPKITQSTIVSRVSQPALPPANRSQYRKPPYLNRPGKRYQNRYRQYQPNYRRNYRNNHCYRAKPPRNNYRNRYKNRRTYDNRRYNRKRKKRSMFNNFNPANPRKSMSNFWDDAIDAPNSMGEMPGGWNMPSVTLPNPVDSADDFGKGIRDIPEGFDYN